MKVLLEYMPPQPDSPPPPFLWGAPAVVRDRLGDRVEELRFEKGTVRYPAVSPAHFWESMTTDSGAILLMLEEVDDRDRSDLYEEEARTLGHYFSDADNAMELEYQLVTATVV